MLLHIKTILFIIWFNTHKNFLLREMFKLDTFFPDICIDVMKHRVFRFIISSMKIMHLLFDFEPESKLFYNCTIDYDSASISFS